MDKSTSATASVHAAKIETYGKKVQVTAGGCGYAF